MFSRIYLASRLKITCTLHQEKKWKFLTDMYCVTSELATIDAEIRFTGSTEYSARALRIALV